VINPSPVVKFSVPAPSCVSKDISLIDASSVSTGSIVKWNWDLGDGTKVQKTSSIPFSHIYSTAKTYTVLLQAQTDKGCINSMSHDIVVSDIPVPGFTLPDNCLADPFSLFLDTTKIADGTQGLFSYEWDFGDANATPPNSNISTQQNPKHKYTAVGPYKVSLKVTSNKGCVSSITKQFVVNGTQPQPLFTLNALSQCSNSPLTVTNHSSIDVGRIVRIEIFWDDLNDQSNKSVINYPQNGAVYAHTYPTFFTPASKNYQVRMVSYSGDVCFNESSQQITLKASPEIHFDPLPSVCADVAPFQINSVSVVNAMEGSGTFSGPGVSSSGIFNPRIAGAGNAPILYTFAAANGCTETAEQTAIVFPLPLVNAGPDRTVLEGGNTVLMATGSGNNVSYRWTPATGLNNASILQPVSSPADDIYYTIKVTSADGCAASDEVFVKVLKAPSVPNVFTPNGDGINDKWEIKYLESYPGCTVQIFNSYGQLVFESTGYKAWDGTFKGKQVPAGTYYYIINPKNGRKQMSGFVDIVR
jgi:gliding motility-associated-like protein